MTRDQIEITRELRDLAAWIATGVLTDEEVDEEVRLYCREHGVGAEIWDVLPEITGGET